MRKFTGSLGLAAAVTLGILSLANANPPSTGIAGLDQVFRDAYDAAVVACSPSVNGPGAVLDPDPAICENAVAFFASLASPGAVAALPTVAALGLSPEQLDEALTSDTYIFSFSAALVDVSDAIVQNNPPGSPFLAAFSQISLDTLGFLPGAGPDVGPPIQSPGIPS